MAQSQLGSLAVSTQHDDEEQERIARLLDAADAETQGEDGPTTQWASQHQQAAGEADGTVVPETAPQEPFDTAAGAPALRVQEGSVLHAHAPTSQPGVPPSQEFTPCSLLPESHESQFDVTDLLLRAREGDDSQRQPTGAEGQQGQGQAVPPNLGQGQPQASQTQGACEEWPDDLDADMNEYADYLAVKETEEQLAPPPPEFEGEEAGAGQPLAGSAKPNARLAPQEGPQAKRLKPGEAAGAAEQAGSAARGAGVGRQGVEDLLQRLFPDDDGGDMDGIVLEDVEAPAAEDQQQQLEEEQEEEDPWWLPRLLAMDVRGECVSVTSVETGVRVYCSKACDPVAAADNVTAGAGAARVVGATAWGLQQQRKGDVGCRQGRAVQAKPHLLQQPISQLMRQLDDERIAEAMAESERAERELREAVGGQLETVDGASVDEGRGEGEAAATRRRAGEEEEGAGGWREAEQLWVNKYAPRGFMSLLSDEATNRELAKWVKSWDLPTSRGAAGATGSRWGKSAAAATASAAAAEQSANDRVVLIAGPPGLGKTTLAHVVARHCGYHPFEINASDDRNAAGLTQRVNDAVQMRAVVGDGKPNCVIVDEVDGATGGSEAVSAVSALLRIVNAGTAAAAKGKEGAEPGTGKKANQQPRLRRPIICICNDLYAPALRPLRAAAKVLHFRAPAKERLVLRLQYICAREGVKADKQALQALCDRNDCDIRSCLNTLQFLARRPNGPGGRITLSQVRQVAVGTKDTTRSAIAIWSDILQTRRAGGGARRGPTAAADAHRELWEGITAFGENDLLLAGVFENLHGVRLLDINLQKTSFMMDRLADAHALLCRPNLMHYFPTALLHVHMIAAQPEKVNVSWPRPYFDAASRQQATAEVVRGWASSVAPSVAQAHSRGALVQAILPALKTVLAPPIRPMAAHLLSEPEQQLMTHTVAAMLDYCVSYDFQVAAAQEAAAGGAAAVYRPGFRPNAGSGQPAWRPLPLKPALDTIHAYTASSGPWEGCAPGSVQGAGSGQGLVPQQRALPLVVRQMLSQHAQLEAIRRAEAMRGITSKTDVDAAAAEGRAAAVPGGQPGKPGQAKGKPPGAASLQVKGMSEPPASKRNWLEAMRTNAMIRKKPGAAAKEGAAAGGEAENVAPAGTGWTLAQRGSAAADTGQFKVLYRFNEGYTNAVKRPMLVKELL